MHTYLGWEELNDEPPPPPAEVSPEQAAGWEVLERLMKERAQVEQGLMKLLGKAPPDPADARELARFPMPVHTVETRMADRAAAREEERKGAAARRSIERQRLRERDVQERIEKKREAEAVALAAQAQREADERHEDERQQDRKRAVLVEALIHAGWEEQRGAALDATANAKEQEWNDFTDKYTHCHERARHLNTHRRREDKALAARLDSRHRRPNRDDARRKRPKTDDGPDRRRRRERTL